MSRLCVSLCFVLATTVVQPASPVEIPQDSMIAVHPSTRDKYIATGRNLLHLTADFTVVKNVSLDSLTNETKGYVHGIGIDDNEDRLVVCWSFNDGQCALFNTTNIEHYKWCEGNSSACNVKTRSYFVFLGNQTLLVGSSINTKTGPMPILSLRKLSTDPFSMAFLKTNQTSRINIQSGCRHSVEFMYGFKLADYVYFMTHQKSHREEKNTVLIRVNGNGATLFPVKEISIDCFDKSLPVIYQVTNDSVFALHRDQPFNTTVAMTFCGYNLSTLNRLLDKTPGENDMKPSWLCQRSSDNQCTSANYTCPNSVRVPAPSPDNQVVLQLKPAPDGSPKEHDLETLLAVREEDDTKILGYYSSKLTQHDCKKSNDTEQGSYYWCNEICTNNRTNCLEKFTCEECTKQNSTSLLYWCDGKCTTRRCKNTCIFDEIYPGRGPITGGRIITLRGCGLNDSSVHVKFGDARCEQLNSTNTEYTCELEQYTGHITNLNEDGKASTLPANETLILKQSDNCSGLVYTFESNPIITGVNRNKTYKRGGVNLTVEGDGFDLFRYANMRIGFNGTSTNPSACEIKNRTLMYCLTLPIESEVEPINASLYFQLENVNITKYIQLYDNPSFNNLTSQETETFSDGQNLTISGDFDGVKKDDVTFTVASTNCLDVFIADNDTLLICGVDWDKLRTERIEGKQTAFVSITDAGNITFGINIKLGDRNAMNSLFTREHFIGVIAGGVALGFLLLCACLGCLCCLRKKEKSKEIHIYQATSTTRFDDKALHTYFELQPKEKLPNETMQKIIDNQLMLPADQLKLGEQIGAGNFGCVYKGELFRNPQENTSETVAVKTIHEGNLDLKSFVEEALMMKEFHHKNVLQLLGISVSEEHQPMVVLPFMANGDLLSFIVDEQKEMCLSTILRWGVDISEGMDYLSTLKLVHRDLAARNCMLDENLCVKVADFGLSRDIYEQGMYTSDNKKKLPIRWMAPESMDRGVYTSKSDVWSLGVVLWELLTRGATPYPGVEGWDISRYLHRGRRLRQPWFCVGKLYDIMLEIWSLDPNQRPTFATIAEMLTDLLQQEVLSQNLEDENVTFPECCQFVQLPSLDYFVLEPEFAGRETTKEGMELDVAVHQQENDIRQLNVVVV